jgi:hypothetical protein
MKEVCSINQMEKTTLAFLGLLTVLLIGQWLFTESFVDISDNSGTMIRMSLSDLMAILTAKNSSSSSSQRSSRNDTRPTVVTTNATLDSTTYNSLLGDIKKTVQDELLSNAQEGGLLSGAGSQGGDQTLTDSCIDNFSQQQGADFMRYVPGKNPNDYIRKDSIPCYGCNL